MALVPKPATTVVIAVLTALLLHPAAGCKKDGNLSQNPADSVVNLPPGTFTLQVTGITSDSAVISWSAAIDPNKDSVRYSIYLNDTLKVSNLSTLSYTFSTLKELTAYTVKVVAADPKQKTSSAAATFSTKKYWLRYLRKIEFGPITQNSFKTVGQMIKANDGGYLMVGDAQLGETINDPIKIFVKKIDSLGNEVWTQRYNYASGYLGNIKLASNNNNGYIICGSDKLIKIDNNGNLVWVKAATLTQEQWNGMGVGPDGSIYTVGNAVVYPPSGNYLVAAVIAKFDQSGNVLWKKTYTRTIREELYEVKIFANDEVIALGQSGDPDSNYWLLRLNAEGDVTWEKTFDDGGYAFAKSLIKTKEGNYVFTGYSVGAYMIPTLYLQMTDPSGNELWRYHTYDNWMEGFCVAETNDNALIVTGGYVLNYSIQSGLYKFDKNGNKLWEKLYGEFATYLVNKSVIPTADGGYLTHCGKSKAYNTPPEVDQIYLYKTDDKGDFY